MTNVTVEKVMDNLINLLNVKIISDLSDCAVWCWVAGSTLRSRGKYLLPNDCLLLGGGGGAQGQGQVITPHLWEGLIVDLVSVKNGVGRTEYWISQFYISCKNTTGDDKNNC